jgi:hypothetical protein
VAFDPGIGVNGTLPTKVARRDVSTVTALTSCSIDKSYTISASALIAATRTDGAGVFASPIGNVGTGVLASPKGSARIAVRSAAAALREGMPVPRLAFVGDCEGTSDGRVVAGAANGTGDGEPESEGKADGNADGKADCASVTDLL